MCGWKKVFRSIICLLIPWPPSKKWIFDFSKQCTWENPRSLNGNERHSWNWRMWILLTRAISSSPTHQHDSESCKNQRLSLFRKSRCNNNFATAEATSRDRDGRLRSAYIFRAIRLDGWILQWSQKHREWLKNKIKISENREQCFKFRSSRV